MTRTGRLWSIGLVLALVGLPAPTVAQAPTPGGTLAGIPQCVPLEVLSGSEAPTSDASPGPSVTVGPATSTEPGASDEPGASVTPTPKPGRTPKPSRAPSAGNVRVDVPAALASTVEALAPVIRHQTGLRIQVRGIGSTAEYQMALLSGSGGDIVIAADTLGVVGLIGDRLATDPVAFACDQLAIIVPAGDPAGLERATDLGRPGLRIVALPETTQVARDAVQLVRSLGIEEAYTANIVDRLAPTELLAAVAAGQADAAIVLLSDARASGEGLAFVPVPAEANITRTLTAALLSTAQRPRRVRPLLTWLVSPDGQEAIQALGFLPAPGSEPAPSTSSGPDASSAP